MSLKNTTVKAIIGFLALLGACDLLGRAVLGAVSYRHSLGPPKDVDFGEPLVSPDGQFKVVQFEMAGGGGFAPFCQENFAVLPAAAPFEAAWQDANIIASLPCLGISEGGVRHGVTWLADHRLRFVFDLTNALQSGSVRLKAHDATSQVFVEYSPRAHTDPSAPKSTNAQPAAKNN